MAVKVILDTDILSEYFKGHNASVAGRAASYAQEHGVFTFTSVTVYEIVYGLELKGASSQLKKVLAWRRVHKRRHQQETRQSPPTWSGFGGTLAQDPPDRCARVAPAPPKE